jgi:hypothetical protein
MSKADWGKPTYQGRPDPIHIANRIMAIIVALLVLGFIQAGIKNDWFTPIINFIIS